MSDTRGVRRRKDRRRRTPAWLWPTIAGIAVLIVAVAVIGVVGVLHALRLERRLTGLPATVQAAQVDAENGQLSRASQALQQAESNLASVNSKLYTSPDFAILNVVPVARQNLAGVRDAVHLGLQMLAGAEQILATASPLESSSGRLDVSLRAGQVPVDTVKALQEIVTSVATGLPVSPSAPGGRLVLARVRRSADMVYAEAERRRRQLTSVADGLNLLAELSGGNGDRRYLLAVANTAEMRGAGGMILSYGVLTGVHGKLTLSHFGPIDELKLTKPAPVAFPADFASRFGNLQPTQEWRQATLMSDFTVDGPVLEAMYKQATGDSVDGVIQVDPVGLAAILTGTGPINVAGLGQVDASNAVALTLNQAYVQFPDRPVRQEYLGTVAQGAFSALTSGNQPSLRPLATALLAATAARHVVMHAVDPTAETLIRTLKFEGGLPGPGVPFTQLTVQNVGGTKMDYYIDSALNVTGAAPTVRSTPVTVDVTLTDTAAPGGKPAYIFGPYNGGSDAPGTYRGLVTIYLPAFTHLESTAGDATATAVTAGTQNGVTALTWFVDIPPGGASHMTVRAVLPPVPPGAPPLAVVPTPRVNPTVASIELH